MVIGIENMPDSRVAPDRSRKGNSRAFPVNEPALLAGTVVHLRINRFIIVIFVNADASNNIYHTGGV
jgi:hypothetical protein